MARLSRIIFLSASSLFLVGVILQVFLAGMVVVALQMGWSYHRDLGHFLALPLLVMIITAYLGKLPRRMKWITWSLFIVYLLQADVLIFMRTSLPLAAAFHPVLALVDCVFALVLVHQAWGLVREGQQESKTPYNSEQFDKIGL